MRHLRSHTPRVQLVDGELAEPLRNKHAIECLAHPSTCAMEGIELRDFAFEDVAQAPVHRRTIELPVKKEVKQADKSALRRFWSTHVRLTIEEAACRDHLGTENYLPPLSSRTQVVSNSAVVSL